MCTCRGLAQPVASKTQFRSSQRLVSQFHSTFCPLPPSNYPRNSTVPSGHYHLPVTLFMWQYIVLALTKLGVSSHPSSHQHVVPVAVLPKEFFIGGGTVTRHLLPASEFPKWLSYAAVFCGPLWTWNQWKGIVTISTLGTNSSRL